MPYLKTIKETNKEQRQRFLKQNNIKKKDITTPSIREKLYSTSAWRKARASKLQETPLCELCMIHNKIKPADQIHHAIKFDRQPTPELQYKLLTDKDNLVSLCFRCHSHIHYQQEELTQEQKEMLLKKKENILDKYYNQNMFIINTEDKNYTNN